MKLEERIKDVKYKLENLVDYAIDYFKDLKVKYGKGRERKTEIKTFENIVASKVVVANKKLYVNREEGFIKLVYVKMNIFQIVQILMI